MTNFTKIDNFRMGSPRSRAPRTGRRANSQRSRGDPTPPAPRPRLALPAAPPRLCIFAAKDAFAAGKDASFFHCEHAFAAATRKTHFSQRKEQQTSRPLEHLPICSEVSSPNEISAKFYINMDFREREQKVKEAPGRAEQSSSAQQVKRFEQN